MKRTLALILALVIVLSMSVIAAADGKDTLIVAAPDESDNLSTTGHDALQTAFLNVLSYNGLMKLDYNMNPVPDLAESYTVSEDGCTWVFKLREGVKFHNGEELTADDVVASMIDAQSKPNVASFTKDYTAVEATDKYTVTITTDGYNSNLLYSLANHANFVLPKSLLESGHDFNAEPCGTGAYKFVKWNHGDSIEYVANEDYFAGAPAIKNLIWRFIPEGTSRSLVLEAGEVDFVIDVDAANMAGIQDNPDLYMDIVDSITLNFLNLNDTKGYLSDVNVRKAIDCAVNKQAVVQIAENGHASVVYAQAPTTFSGSTTEGCVEGYSVEKAKEYLAAWGGNPADIELSIICSNDAKKRAAEVILANLKDVGINATIEQMDLATYLDVTARGEHTGFIGGYSASSMVQYLMMNFHSSSIGAANKSRLNDPEVDALIEKAAAARTNEECAAILEEVNAKINDMCPQVSLYQNQRLYAYKANLANVNVLPNGYFYVGEWYWD